MATLPRLLFFLLPSIVIINTAAAAPYLSPEEQPQPPPQYNLSTLLNNLGFHDISVAAATTTTTPNLTTIFSPTDVSLRSCPNCSLPLLLLEHSVPGLYPFRLLSTLAFGTKIQTLASTAAAPLCLTLTKTTSTTDPTVFVGGVEITRPDLFNDGNLIIHGIQGYLAHLSPFSCQIERMTSLSFLPSSTTPTISIRTSLKDAMISLRSSDYTVLALLLQENLDLLSQLTTMTIFAVDDAGVFVDGHTFVSNLRFHIVPNQRLTALELLDLPLYTMLPTMVAGERLVITVAGGGGPLSPMRINNVKITKINVLLNDAIVVHGIASPLPRVHRTTMGFWPDGPESAGPTAASE